MDFFDLKKMILDIDQVRNVDIIPSKNYKEYSSLYSIWIDTMTTNLGKIEQENLKKNLSLSLSSKRFLGTDFDEINFLKHDLVSLDLEIEISNKVAPKKIAVKKIAKKKVAAKKSAAIVSPGEIVADGSAARLFPMKSTVHKRNKKH